MHVRSFDMQRSRVVPADPTAFVMVRAYSGEPKVLVMVDHDETYLYVGKPHTKSIIGVPKCDVFEYSEAVFQELATAWHANEWQTVAELWHDAVVVHAKK